MKKYICPFCKKEMNRNDVKHIYFCSERDKNLSKDEIKLKYLKYNFEEEIDNKIINDYLNLYSLPMLKEKYGIDYKSIQFILKINDVKIRSISESSNKISKEKYKKTCEKKYGVDNVSKLNEIKNKKSKTFMEHYGVDNIWKTKDYTLNVWNSYSDEKKDEIIKKRYQKINENKTFGSKIELKVIEILENLNISYQRFFLIKNYTHPYDIHLKGTKILLEINGTFWHADPRKYNENDKILLPGKKRNTLAKDIWKKDKHHIEVAEKNGYRVVTIWENEINNNDIESLTKYIINVLNFNEK